MRIKRLCITLGLIAILVAVPKTAYADTTLRTGAEVNVNNLNEDIDYKLTSEEVQDIHNTINSYTNLKSLDRDESELFMTTNFLRNVSDLTYYSEDIRDAETWLIENNVYSRPVRVNLNTLKVTKLYGDLNKDYEFASKSDFLMMLYKAERGVIQSNVANIGGANINRSTSAETGLNDFRLGGALSISDYWDPGVNAELGYDQINYVSPNVYELYLEQMLSIGLINSNELGGNHGEKLYADLFDKDGNPLQSAVGSWRRVAANYCNGSNECLGYANVFRDGVITEGKGRYFKQEKLTVLEAMHYIATFMHKYENISNTEANMIAYKYGLTEFAGVPSQYLEDIYYLVGAGIISFDGSGPRYFISEDAGGSSYLTQGQLFDLMYRVANEGARFTFSVIQLSDAETTLMDAGFLKNDYVYLTPKALPFGMSTDFNSAKNKKHTAGSVGDDCVLASSSSTVAGLFGLFTPVTAYAAGDTKEYLVTKQFDYKYKGNITGNVYKYYSQLTQKEYLISDETDTESLGNTIVQSELETEVKSVKADTVGDYSVYTVVFRVNAYSKAAALKYVNQRITHTSYSNDKHSISALTKIEIDDEETTMISQDSLKGIDDIVVLHDRVLMNKKTKAKCLIQNSLTKLSDITDNTQYGYAIIGSQILSGEPIMIEGSDDSVYYNLKCVLALLPESSYGKLGFGNPGKVNNTLLGISLHKEYTSNYSYGLLNQDYAKFTYIRYKSNNTEQQDNTGNAKCALYNMTNLYKGMTTLSRTFKINFSGGNDAAEDVTFILDLAYNAPSSFKKNLEGSETADAYQLALSTAPTKADNPAMYHYWRRNYALSNALCNMMYGTRDVVYVKSGYFIPKLTVLLPKSFDTKDTGSGLLYRDIFSSNSVNVAKLKNTSYYKVLNKFMYENFHMSNEYSEYLPRTSNGSATIDGWWTTYYGGKSSIKTLFEGLLSDKSAATTMTNLYASVGAQNINIGVASTKEPSSGVLVYQRELSTGESDQSTESSIAGTTTTTTVDKSKKHIYAVLTDCNILYRNVAQPKTIAQSGGAGSVLSVKYSDKKKKLIDSITVLATDDTKANTVPRSSKLSAYSKVYKQGGLTMSIYGAYKYTTDGKNYVLTPMYAPALLGVCNTNGAGMAYLGQGSSLIGISSKGDMGYVYYANGKPVSDIKCIGKRLIKEKKDFNTLCQSVEDLQKNAVLPGSKCCDLPVVLDKKYGSYVKKNLLAEFPYDSVSSTDFLESYKLPKKTVEQYVNGSVDNVTFGYVFSDRVVLLDYRISAAVNSRIIPNNPMEVQLTDLFSYIENDLENKGEASVFIKKAYNGVHFFNCYKFYAARNKFYIDEIQEQHGVNRWPSGKLMGPKYNLHRNMALAEEMSQSFFVNALNDQVIKATLAKGMKLTDVDELPEGARLHVGESIWIKRSGYWESYPIRITGKPNSSWKRSLVNNSFSNASCYNVLSSIWTGYAVVNDGQSYLLKNYVDADSVDIGTGYLGAVPVEKNKYTKQGILARKNDDVIVYKSDKDGMHEKGTSAVYKYITLKFKFQEGKGLGALPINSAGTEYDLMFGADMYSSGKDLAIFDDDLDFKYDSETQVSIGVKDADLNDALRETNHEFRADFTKTTAIDWYRWLRYVILIASCWLFMMLWFAYFILKRGIAYKFLETLAKPGFRNQGKGLDVIKLFTLGILNIDSTPRFNQMMSMTVILILIDVIVGYLL